MLYFAYGSNLNHKQMHIRCKDSRYIKSAFLEGYKLSFCAASRDYGVANIVKKSGSKVPGGIWKISETSLLLPGVFQFIENWNFSLIYVPHVPI